METFSQELIEPGGRGAGAVPEPVELMPLRPRKVGSGIIRNGIRCTSASKGFDDQWFDYCPIDGLDIAMKDQRLRYPTYVETPQHGCIQLHMLKKGQNLAHLLVLYACFGAEGVIFVNTKDDYELRPDLMSSLAVIKGSYPNYCCVLVSRTDGERLMRIINQFPIVFCEINTGSCKFVLADDYYSKAHTRRGSVPVGHNGAQLHDKNLLLIINDRIKDDRAVSRDDFWNVMMACNKIESTWRWDRSLHNMDLLLERLLRPARFGKLFQNDFLFYVALAYRICANINGDSYDCDKRLLRIFRIVCIEALCETQPCTIVESLKSFTERGAFEIAVDEKVVNIFDFLGYGFLELCKLWVKDMKKESKLPSKYWDIAMLCMSFSQKLYTTSVSHDTASLWKEHIERHSSKITSEHDDFYHLCKGLNYMPLLGVSSSKAFTPTHFADFICSGPVRKFTFMNKLVILFCDFNIDFWERHLRYFLVRTRSEYDKFLRSRQLSYAALSKIGGMFGAFQEGWIFMFQVLDISKKRNCYDSLKEECFDWSSTVLSIINFNNLDAVPCIGLIVTSLSISNTPHCYAAHVAKQLNDRLFQCCQKLCIEKFQPVFSEAMFWKPRILESYLGSYTPQPDIIVCSDKWQKLLQAASDSPLGNSKTLLKLMQKIGKQYQISKRPRDFILHLMRLETPNLFQCPANPHAECYTDDFVSFLKSYISMWSLKEGLIKNYCYILECTRCEMNQFMMLIVSAVLEEVFTEITADVLEVLQSEIVPQLHEMLGGLLQSGDYTTVQGICILGTLKRVSDRINPSDDSLNWLNDYSQLTLELCRCFNVICKSISHRREKKELDVDIEHFLEDKQGDFRDFVRFCQHLQIILLSWKEKVITQNVLQIDIRQLKELCKWFNWICEVAIVPNACIDEEDVKQLADTYEDIKSHFGELLIQRIPKEVSNEWCYLSEILLRLKVTMPADIEAELQKYIVFPDRTRGTVSAQFDVTINLNAKLACIPVARSLLSKLLIFIQPLTENLKIIVFFHLKESKHFFMYLHHFIEKVKHVQAGYQRDEIARAADAIKHTLALLHDMFLGSATFSNVTLNGAVDLSNTNQVDYELQLLADFATSDLCRDLLQAPADLDGMYGLRCYVELDAINKYISTINEVLKNFKLDRCLASDEHKLLKITVDAMKKKEKMTLKYASDKLAKLKSALHLKSQSDLTQLRLFEPVKRCTPFYQFAEKSNFTGPNGRELFLAQYRIVAPQVQHDEEYNQAILHHLYRAYSYIVLFFDKKVSFQDLMSAIMQMPDIDKGIENLKIVSENFSLIKLWFSNVEGETAENIERDLKFILQSGECVFFTKEDESTVRFHLEYNRTSSRRTSDSEPQDFSASVPKSCGGYVQWTLEEMNEFAMKLSFLKCKKHNSQLVDFWFYQELFNNSVKLLHSYQDLKALGHPDYQRLHEKFFCAKTEAVNIQMKVEEVQNELCRWISVTKSEKMKEGNDGENLGELLQHEQTLALLEDTESEATCLKERDALLQKQNSCLHNEHLAMSKINKHSITRLDEEAIKEVVCLKEMLADLQKQKVNLEEWKSDHIQKSSGLQREIARLQADNMHALEMNSNYVAEIARLQKDIADLQELNTHHVAEITRLQGEVVNLQEDKRQLSLKVDINFWLVNSCEVHSTGEVLGEGAWGKVTVGSFRGQRVAIKQLHTAIKSDFFITLFHREISMMAKVRHPNLLLFIAAVLDPSSAPIIVTELLDTSLRHAYESNQLTSRCTKISILRDVAAALNYLHLQRDPIIHRDVSSSNVLLQALPGKCWRAKLSDFGSANLARYSSTPAPGAIVYSAPEAFIEGKQSPKIDVFSYGKLFCEVCTSTFPFPDAFPLMLQSMVREWSNIHQTILNCMEHDPAKRPTMSSIVNKLITSTV